VSKKKRGTGVIKKGGGGKKSLLEKSVCLKGCGWGITSGYDEERKKRENDKQGNRRMNSKESKKEIHQKTLRKQKSGGGV